ncbi:unnamed protein product [Rotaria magnacalcarata]|uniref:Uncharacterized protein n=1 Tax=Rotaria magnacalcarata TaxID=392030 RepID=A0A816ZYR9_9BILA|nr:unnamed protein product [Rotaria magnacalcarata]
MDPSIHRFYKNFREFGILNAQMTEIDCFDKNVWAIYKDNVSKFQDVLMSCMESTKRLGINSTALVAQEEITTADIHQSFPTRTDCHTANRAIELHFKHLPTTQVVIPKIDTVGCNDVPLDGYKQCIDFISHGAHTLEPMTYEQNGSRALLYKQLASIYKKQKNWEAVFEYYEQIIHGSESSPKSFKVTEVHIEYAKACMELKDYFKALLIYHKALGVQLQQQHSTSYPLMAEIELEIGNLYDKSGDIDNVLTSYHEVVELGHSDMWAIQGGKSES